MDTIDLCRLGHVASARRLRELGVTRRAISAAVSRERLHRVARGVYACAHIDTELAVALRAGCAIDCVSALERHGVWSGIAPHGLHLRAKPHHHIGRVPPGTNVHWAATFSDSLHEVSPIDALLQAMRCLEPYDALASVESALHLGYLHESELDRLIALAPQRMHRTLRRLDRGAQSGVETLPRLWLTDAGHRVRTQVQLPGTGPLDLLVDERVGIEIDGKRWHEDRFVWDRTKDIITETEGIRSLRLAYTHIVDSWPRTLAAIERMIREARP